VADRPLGALAEVGWALATLMGCAVVAWLVMLLAR
jgi:hypothetical protein